MWTNSGGSNLASVAAITNKPLYQQPVVDGVWFFEGWVGNLHYPYAGQAQNRLDALTYFDSLGLGLNLVSYIGDVPYVRLVAV